MNKLRNVSTFTIALISIFVLTYCKPAAERKLAEGVILPNAEQFATTHNGKPVALYTLENKNGLRVDITNYGGRIVSLLAPDRNNVFDDIVTGYHTIGEYIASREPYFGSLIGRYGNRIAKGRFSIDGIEYNLAINNNPNHLHGGPGGFHNVVWDAEMVAANKLKLTYLSADGEEGYPGNLNVTVYYSLTEANELVIEYEATTDKPTILNLTNHAFYNLAGEGESIILDHLLLINADYYTPVNQHLIPAGVLVPVEGTPFDFRAYTPIGARINDNHQQLFFGLGYDHNYVLNKVESATGEPQFAASVIEPVTGRKMDIYTTEPGIQFYSGNFLNGTETGKRGQPYPFRSSFCLETQHFPDSPNQPDFPSTVLRPGETYRQVTKMVFGVATEKDVL